MTTNVANSPEVDRKLDRFLMQHATARSALNDCLARDSDNPISVQELRDLSDGLGADRQFTAGTIPAEFLEDLIANLVERPAVDTFEGAASGWDKAAEVAAEVVPFADKAKSWFRRKCDSHPVARWVYGAAKAANSARRIRNNLASGAGGTSFTENDSVSALRKKVGLQALAASIEIGNRAYKMAPAAPRAAGKVTRIAALGASGGLGTASGLAELGIISGIGIASAAGFLLTGGLAGLGVVAGWAGYKASRFMARKKYNGVSAQDVDAHLKLCEGVRKSAIALAGHEQAAVSKEALALREQENERGAAALERKNRVHWGSRVKRLTDAGTPLDTRDTTLALGWIAQARSARYA